MDSPPLIKAGQRGSGRGRGRDRKGQGLGAGGAAGREVVVSKKLSYVLRHAAEKEGLKMDEKGFVNCADMVW